MTESQIDMLDAQYPQTWSDYVGQEIAKQTLRRSATAAKKLGENLPHILITSPYAGIGKTALALLTIRASGRPVFMASGAMTMEQALDMFSQCEDGDVVFYDEFHAIMNGGPRKAEWLLNYLQDGVLLTPWGPEAVPKVSFVAATTDRGLILPTILDRFLEVELEPYTPEQGAGIATVMSAKILGKAHLATISDDVAAAVARASNNQPRRMGRLLTTLRDLAVCDEIASPEDGSYDVAQALTAAGVTPDGLTKEARKMMLLLKSSTRPVGEAMLKQRMGLVGKGLQMVERLLLDKGYIGYTGGGRALTMEGNRRANALLRDAA
jgi:Holliday junction DNA helicase RuvB